MNKKSWKSCEQNLQTKDVKKSSELEFPTKALNPSYGHKLLKLWTKFVNQSHEKNSAYKQKLWIRFGVENWEKCLNKRWQQNMQIRWKNVVNRVWKGV